jgi:hypothetical protein
MAVDFQFVSAFLCERTLQEKQDEVLSAIRLVDTFLVPVDRPEHFAIQFALVWSFRTLTPPDPAGYRLGITLIRSTGDRERLIEPTEMQPQAKFVDASIPWGIAGAVPVRLLVRNLGTAFLEIEVNGTVVTRVPFTLLEPPAPQTSEQTS